MTVSTMVVIHNLSIVDNILQTVEDWDYDHNSDYNDGNPTCALGHLKRAGGLSILEGYDSSMDSNYVYKSELLGGGDAYGEIFATGAYGYIAPTVRRVRERLAEYQQALTNSLD